MAEPGACGKLQASVYDRGSSYGRSDAREHACLSGGVKGNETSQTRPLKGRMKKNEYDIAKAMP
jgi:hypothetical protein